MSKHFTVVCLASFASLLQAQYAKPPQAYSATVVNAMFGPNITMKINRDGSKAAIENLTDPQSPGGKGSHTRSYYDLETHRTYGMDLNYPTANCNQGKFAGDWGDPFEQSAGLMADVLKQNPQQTGSETLNGFATKIMETGAGDQKVKVWLDTRYGLVVKAQLGSKTIIELKELRLGKPAASLLILPAACAALPPPPLSKVEQFAKDTGTSPGDYVDPTTTATGSPNSCMVLLRMLHTGTLQPIASGFRMGLDTTADVDHPAHYVVGGATLFSGGGFHEVTGQVRNGELRIDNAPPAFYVQAWFEHGGPDGMFRRNCFAPQTVLLLVMNPENLSNPVSWLWVKSGKFASANARQSSPEPDAQAAVKATRPLAYYRLESANGSSEAGGTTYQSVGGAASSGRGALLNGKDAWVKTTQMGGIGKAGSIMAWVNLATLPNAERRILYVAGESESGNDFDLQFEPDNHLRFYTSGGGNVSYAPDPKTLVNQWHMIVVTMDAVAPSKIIYWDGQPVARDQSANRANKTSRFTIGESPLFNGRFFHGGIDDVAIWNRALSTDEVAAMYKASAR